MRNPFDLFPGTVFLSFFENFLKPMSNKKKEPELPPQDLIPESDLPPDADIEERFNDFWKKNGPSIFGGIALGAVIVVGIQLFQYFADKKEQGIRDAFAAATSVEEKQQFVEDNSSHQLAALAQLQLADARYDEGKYQEAADLYAESARIFEDPILVSRALLGQGVSLVMGGSVESGQGILEAVALDAQTLDGTRGEAAFHLAVSQWESGDAEKALATSDLILQLNSAQFWVYRANILRERLNAELEQ